MWFPREEITSKREELKSLIQRLSIEYTACQDEDYSEEDELEEILRV